jgi:hypothetical protein
MSRFGSSIKLKYGGVRPNMELLRKIAILLVLSGWVPSASPQEAGMPRAVGHSGGTESLELPPTEAPIKITPTKDQREGLIHLDVSARDENGRSFGISTGTDIALLQDGAATKILSFHRSNSNSEDERLSEVCLVLDEVDLSSKQFGVVKSETINFLRRNDGVLAQPVSMLWLKTDGVYMTAFPTADGNSLAQDIASSRVIPTSWKFHLGPQPGVGLQAGSTPQVDVTFRDDLWIEVLRTVYALALKWRDQPGRKALLWVGYGWSIRGELNSSGGPFPILVELSTRIREARMVIYDISPWPDPEIPVHDKIPTIDYRQFLPGVRSSADPGLQRPGPHFALPVLAVQSGGLVLDDAQNLGSDVRHDLEHDIGGYLGDEMGRCIVDASDFYTVSFDPPHAAQPDEYHDLAILMGTEQLRTRTTQGYYNQPVFYDEPRVAERRLDVADLQQLLETDRDEHDRELAGKLKSLELTERLTTETLAVWKEHLHGKEAKAALTVLGDESAFLAPPMAEVPGRPTPDENMQHQITLRAEKYLDGVVPMLPDFSADAVTVKYEQPSPDKKDAWKGAPRNRALIQTVNEQATLLYRNGREQRIVEKRAGKLVAARNDLNYKGIFGPILGFVLEDVRRGNSKLTWTRWERTSQGTLAVFRYSVRAGNPRYGVVYCCLVGGRAFETLPEHHGELAIDPDTGAIVRITVESDPGWIRETDLSPVRPVLFSNMMVEYGRVDIGGRKFICPKRSVVMTRERTVRPISFWGLNFEIYGPYQSLMNDTAYANYHKFGSESRMLPGFEVVRDNKTP